MTPERLVRRIFQVTGCEIEVRLDPGGLFALITHDGETDEAFVMMSITKSRLPQALRDMHEAISRARQKRDKGIFA